MPLKHRRSEEFELMRRASADSDFSSSACHHDVPRPVSTTSLPLRFVATLCSRLSRRPARAFYSKLSPSRPARRPLLRWLVWAIAAASCVLFALITLTALFRPSYANPPEHYKALRRKCLGSKEPGRGNPHNEKVFLATTLYDPAGTLVRGAWGNAVTELIDLIGPDNVYLSIYENDADPEAEAALQWLKGKLECNSTLLTEHLPLEDISRVTTPTGEKLMKRIAFLAEVRNRALRPLEQGPPARYDRLLFLNDVMFDPIDVIQLLFSTNVDSSGRANYGAACAVDFIDTLRFYDTFATRDIEGYGMGIPLFPWFTDSGNGLSRKDVLQEKDAVRVTSCWGGMTAFEAKWFYKSGESNSSAVVGGLNSDLVSKFSPLRFRYEEDPYWDASECCLIHADLTYLRHGLDTATDSGIFTNPYVRVAYDSQTLRWLPYIRRVERIFPLVQKVLNHLVGMPEFNPRRLEKPGTEVVEKVWKYDKPGSNSAKGSYQAVKRVVDPGRFCGNRNLFVLNENTKPGEKKWKKVPLPKPARE